MCVFIQFIKHYAKIFFVFLQGSDMDSFNTRPTALNSGNLEKLQHVLDYRCIVGGGEQVFLLGLGVRNIYSLCMLCSGLCSYCIKDTSVVFKLKPCVCVEISDLHLGRQGAVTLEKVGELQTGAAQRHTTECRDRSGAEGRGKEWENWEIT